MWTTFLMIFILLLLFESVTWFWWVFNMCLVLKNMLIFYFVLAVHTICTWFISFWKKRKRLSCQFMTLPSAAKPSFILKSCTAKFEVQTAFIVFSSSWRQTDKMATYSEVPNKQACSLRFLRIFFHHTRKFLACLLIKFNK